MMDNRFVIAGNDSFNPSGVLDRIQRIEGMEKLKGFE
jgi:hypothetical protein